MHVIGVKDNFPYIQNLSTFCFSYKMKTIGPNWLKISHKRKNIISLHVLKSQLIQTSSFDFIGKIVFLLKMGYHIL